MSYISLERIQVAVHIQRSLDLGHTTEPPRGSTALDRVLEFYLEILSITRPCEPLRT
jgi:hypothetical protein